MLAGLQDNRLVVWLYPAAVFIDRDIFQKTIFENDENDFGKSAYLHKFVYCSIFECKESFRGNLKFWLFEVGINYSTILKKSFMFLIR